jgi:hypothetical protein
MDTYPDNDGKTLSDRVADIEKCIGDIADVFKALRSVLAGIPEPTCPPYCLHGTQPDYYLDEMKIEHRVADNCRYIADYGYVFAVLNEALSANPEPTCPPYCAHEK